MFHPQRIILWLIIKKNLISRFCLSYTSPRTTYDGDTHIKPMPTSSKTSLALTALRLQMKPHRVLIIGDLHVSKKFSKQNINLELVQLSSRLFPTLTMEVTKASFTALCYLGYSNSTHLPLVPLICVSELGQHWFRQCLGAKQAPSHYLNQCRLIVNWTLRNTFQCKLNRNCNIFIQENAFENVVYEMTAMS